MRPSVFAGALLGGVIGAAVGPGATNLAISRLWPGPFTPTWPVIASLPIVALAVAAGAWLGSLLDRR